MPAGDLQIPARDAVPVAAASVSADVSKERVAQHTAPVQREAPNLKFPARAAAIILLLGMTVAGAYLAWTFWAARDSANVQPPAAPQQLAGGRILHFYADLAFVSPGGKTTICYGVENASILTIEPAIIDVTPSANRCFDYQPQSTQQYRLTVRGPDGVNVSENLSIGVAIKPLSEVGRLIVIAGESGADVIVGNLTMRTGRNGSVDIPLDPGQHQVSVQKEGFETIRSRPITIQAGRETLMNVPLKARPTQLVLTGAPVGAFVTVDGRTVGVIPSSGNLAVATSPGNHVVVLRKEGFVDKSLNVAVDFGQSQNVTAADVAMSPIPRPASTPAQPTGRLPRRQNRPAYAHGHNSRTVRTLPRYSNLFVLTRTRLRRPLQAIGYRPLKRPQPLKPTSRLCTPGP